MEDEEPTGRKARLKALERDMGFHERMRVAHETGLINIYTNFNHLNRGGSPVFSMGDNLWPLLFLILGSVALLFLHFIVGVSALVISVLLYLLIIRPWIANRLRERTVRKMMTNLYNWRQIWAFGGVVVTLSNNARIGCAAPTSDWRALARRFSIEIDPQGEEAHAVFRKNPGQQGAVPSIYD